MELKRRDIDSFISFCTMEESFFEQDNFGNYSHIKTMRKKESINDSFDKAMIGDGCLAKVRSSYTSLSSAEKKVADFLLDHPLEVVHLSINELAKQSNVAKATIVRFCQSIGYKGYRDLKISLARDSVPVMLYIQQDISLTDDSSTIIKKVLQANIEALYETVKILDIQEIEKAVNAMLSAENIGFYGVGGSSPIANEAYQRFIRMGFKCCYSNDPHVQISLALSCRKNDVALGVSHSGYTPETVRCLKIARKNEATTICITNYNESPLTEVSDVKLITSFKDSGFPIEKMGARVAQLAIVETLAANVAAKIPRKASLSIEKLRAVLKDLM